MQCLTQIFAVGGEKRLFCPHTGKPVVRHASRAHPRTQHHGLGGIPIRVGGRLVGITGHTAADENRLYGKNGVSLHPISGETR